MLRKRKNSYGREARKKLAIFFGFSILVLVIIGVSFSPKKASSEDSGTWINGTGEFSNIQIYSEDMGGSWGQAATCPFASNGSKPCMKGLDYQDLNSTLVSPQKYPAINFANYYAQNACRAIGGRLPLANELIAIEKKAAIYPNRGTYSFSYGHYWSATEDTVGDTSKALYLVFDGQTTGGPGSEAKSENNYYRCVRDVTTYTLTYTAASNGAISGTSPQTVSSGGSGTAVTAVPNTGYHFTNWSDGSTSNPRTDTNVTANISVVANFAVTTPTCSISSFKASTLPDGVKENPVERTATIEKLHFYAKGSNLGSYKVKLGKNQSPPDSDITSNTLINPTTDTLIGEEGPYDASTTPGQTITYTATILGYPSSEYQGEECSQSINITITTASCSITSATATPSSGDSPLAVSLTGTGTTSPASATMTFRWIYDTTLTTTSEDLVAPPTTTHTYNATIQIANYSAKLIGLVNGGATSCDKTVAIIVTPLPSVSCGLTSSKGVTPFVTSFSYSINIFSPFSVTKTTLNMGDGTSDLYSVEPPTTIPSLIYYTYKNSGSHTATLHVEYKNNATGVSQVPIDCTATIVVMLPGEDSGNGGGESAL